MPGMADMTAAWSIGDVEIPSRIVLAPMAGVSVQAFRRQGRRFGAGLVCSEMVSSCGLSYGNERTLGYLRIAPDEHPLAVQIFGSDPGPMAEAAQHGRRRRRGHRRHQLRLPGAQGHEDRRRRERARGSRPGLRAGRGRRRRGRRAGHGEDAPRRPQRIALGARRSAPSSRRPGSPRSRCTPARPSRCTPAPPTTRSRRSWSTGSASRWSPRATSPTATRAERVIDATGAAAVMVGRGAQGRPWALREMAGEGAADADAAEVVAELVRFMREVEREMGERAVGFLRKFYGWYLRGLPGAKTIRGALMGCQTRGRRRARAALLLPARRGRCSPPTRPSSTCSPTSAPTGCSSCRSRSTAAAEAPGRRAHPRRP